MDEIRKIVDFMVKTGTGGNYGNWSFDIPELCEKFDRTLEWFYANNETILEELSKRKEVADVVQAFDFNNNPLNYDLSYSTTKAKELWKVFWKGRKEIFAYTVRGEGEDEEEATKALLAYENHYKPSEIHTTLEMR